MIDFLSPVDAFGAQTLRLAAEAAVGGGDIFEIDDVCRLLTPGDVEGWTTA